MGAVAFGLLTGTIGFFIAAGILYNTCWEDKAKPVVMYGIAALIVILFFAIGYVPITSKVNVESQQFCASFEAKKGTYESAMKDENITGFERLQITQNIMELNGDLASEQVNVTQWYNFNISEENRNKTLSLTPIK